MNIELQGVNIELTKYSGLCYLEAIMAIFFGFSNIPAALFILYSHLAVLYSHLAVQLGQKEHKVLVAASNSSRFEVR